MIEEPQAYTEPDEVQFRRWVERCVNGEVKQQVQNDRFWGDLRQLALDWQSFMNGHPEGAPYVCQYLACGLSFTDYELWRTHEHKTAEPSSDVRAEEK